MKYENFEKAKKLVKEIDEAKRTQDSMMNDNVSVQINATQFKVLGIGTWKDSEHELKSLASDFVIEVLKKYADKIKSLTAELDKL